MKYLLNLSYRTHPLANFRSTQHFGQTQNCEDIERAQEGRIRLWVGRSHAKCDYSKRAIRNAQFCPRAFWNCQTLGNSPPQRVFWVSTSQEHLCSHHRSLQKQGILRVLESTIDSEDLKSRLITIELLHTCSNKDTLLLCTYITATTRNASILTKMIKQLHIDTDSSVTTAITELLKTLLDPEVPVSPFPYPWLTSRVHNRSCRPCRPSSNSFSMRS